MQIRIPISQVDNGGTRRWRNEVCGAAPELGIHGGGVWDRKRDLGVYSALDFWGRHEYYVGIHHPKKHGCQLSRAVQLGHGDMHLDDWFATSELIGSSSPSKFDFCKEQPLMFEAKVNVSDFGREELRVRSNPDSRVLTIEGLHVHQNEYDEQHRHIVTPRDSLHATFRRSLTLPKAVLGGEIACRLTANGHFLIITAPVKQPKFASVRRMNPNPFGLTVVDATHVICCLA